MLQNVFYNRQRNYHKEYMLNRINENKSQYFTNINITLLLTK